MTMHDNKNAFMTDFQMNTTNTEQRLTSLYFGA